ARPRGADREGGELRRPHRGGRAPGRGRGLRARGGRGRPAAGGPPPRRPPGRRPGGPARPRPQGARASGGPPGPGRRGRGGGDAPTIDVAAMGDAHAVLEPLVGAAEPDSILVTAAAARTLERRFELVPVAPDDATREPTYRLQDLERPGLAVRGHMTRLVGR